jgi:multimeric flavodoxin WrbA
VKIRLLVLSGSPVEGSSTDFLLGEIADALTAAVGPAGEVDRTLIRLNDLDFKACQACGEAPAPGFCFLDDGLNRFYPLLAAADCLLLGSPIYFDTVSAQTKLLIDRCNCFRPADFDDCDPVRDFIPLIKRQRPGAMVLVGGERGYFEGARRTVAGFFKWLEVTNEGLLIFKSKDFRNKGGAARSPEAIEEARNLGRRLAERIVVDA